MTSSLKLPIKALLLGIACGLTSITVVQAAPESSTANLKAWDTDHDGTLDLTEATKAAEARFDNLDADHDGTLDSKEIAPTGVHKMTFSHADTDKDGTLVKTEYTSLVEARFKAADTDRDGTVSQDELDTKAGKALSRLL
jgi:Ca2+-binding EF-hand superfamily protein